MELVRTDAEKGLIDLAKSVEINGPQWLQDAQNKAQSRFAELGLPHRRVEEWKYTDLRARLKNVYQPGSSQQISSDQLDAALGDDFSSLNADRLVIVNGRFDDGLSSTAVHSDVEVLSIERAIAEKPDWFERFNDLQNSEVDAVQALNLAMMQGGIAVYIGDQVKLERPIQLIFLNSGSEPSMQTSRCFFSIGAGAQVDLLECHVQSGGGAYQSNIVTELDIGEEAEVRHVKFCHEASDTIHLANVFGTLGANTNYNLFQMTIDGGVTRNQVEIRFNGDEARANISGTALLAGSSHADMTLVMDHVGLGCSSRELFKTVLDDEARAVFQGKVIVQPGAQKTDGEMMSKALLLSELAEFDSKPELEIYADDVLCGHGATTGQIDDELMFYLLARGVPAPDARSMLIQAFVGEALELIEHDDIRRLLVARAFQRHKVRGAIDFAA